MQVKKFEARSMKEALEMVKKEFGPEAIILSAKDNGQRYGLLGEGSVEVTAAISETSLHKKKFVETKLPDHLKENFNKAPARSQKEWVEKLVTSYQRDHQKSRKEIETQKAIKERRYIDISDDVDFEREEVQRKIESKSVEIPEMNRLQREVQDLRAMIQRMVKTDSSQIGTKSSAVLNLPVELISLFERLKASGLKEEFALNLLDLAKSKIPALKHSNRSIVEGWIVNYILENSQVTMPAKKIQIFMGPPGTGKTTMLVKWATHLIKRQQKKVAILTMDQSKLGAVQQLRMYAQILNVPFVSMKHKNDWEYVSQELNDYDYLLCDFPGSSLKSDDETAWIQSLLPSREIDADRHLVINASSGQAEMNQAYLNYKFLRPTSFVFTRIDESKQRGSLFELSYLQKMPIFAFGLGQRIPDDFELASAERIVDFILQISKSGGVDANR